MSISRTGNFTTLRATASSAAFCLAVSASAHKEEERKERNLFDLFSFSFFFSEIGSGAYPYRPLMGRGRPVESLLPVLNWDP